MIYIYIYIYDLTNHICVQLTSAVFIISEDVDFCLTLRETHEALLEKEARKNHFNSISHNHSRDSAIDTDLQEWETETLELDIVSCCRKW